MFALVCVVSSVNFLTGIKVDGFSIPSFESLKEKYEVRVPFEKNEVFVDADCTSDKSDIFLMVDSERLPVGSRVSLVRERTNVFVCYGDVVVSVVFVKSAFDETTYRMPEGIWTPRLNEDEQPKINCARVFGARPGNPFHFFVATSGAEPITFKAENLPDGLTMDEKGLITGTTPAQGSYKVTVTASNAHGADKAVIEIRAGDKIQLTPPFGWNSWYAHSEAISDDAIRSTTEAILSNELHKYGFTYVNIDDCWQGLRSEEAPYKPTGKKPFKVDGVSYGGFEDMKGLTDYVHSLGLKIGIYSGPKLSSYAGFTGSSSFNVTGRDYDSWSPNNGNTNQRGPKFNEQGEGSGHDGNPGVDQPTQVFGRWFSDYDSSLGSRIGPYWFGDIDTKQFAEWGFDYIKWDWALCDNMTFTKDLTKRLHEHILSAKRDIVLSLSNNVNSVPLMKDIKELGAEVARISFDIQDNWFSMSLAASDALNFLDVGGEGFWPDPDMLQIGYIGVPNGLNVDFHKTNLDENMQYFQVSFWTILPAPLLMSGNVAMMDDFTRSLLKNREVIAINQDELGAYAKKVVIKEVLAKVLSDGSVAIGLFNYNFLQETVSFNFADVTKVTGVDFSKGATVRSVWEQKDIGQYSSSFSCELKHFQGTLFRLIPVK